MKNNRYNNHERNIGIIISIYIYIGELNLENKMPATL